MQIDCAARDVRIARLRADPVRLEALLEGMASFLGGMLSLRDAGVRRRAPDVEIWEPTLSPAKLARSPSLAKMFLDVGRYLPTVQMLEDENELAHLEEKARAVRFMEHDILRHTAAGGRLVMLARFYRLKSFRTSFTMKWPDNRHPCTIGGMCHRLVEFVREEVWEWLQLTAARLERAGVAPATTADLEYALTFLSEKVAARITLAKPPSLPETDGLRASALRDFGASDDPIPDSRCAECLGVALDVAYYGSHAFLRDVEGPAVRRSLAKVLESVHPAIGFVGLNAALSDFDRLRAAVELADVELMWDAVDAWQQESGSYAYLALQQVLFVLCAPHELGEERRVLRLAESAAGSSSDAHAPSLELPRPSFCARIDDYVFDRTIIGDKTVDHVLFLVVTQLLYTPRSFELGVVTREAANTAYLAAVRESVSLILYVRESREHLRVGMPLRDFLRNVVDRQSFNYPRIRRAMCGLSGFSAQEIFDTFNPTGPMYQELSGRLQAKTAGALTVPLPRHGDGVVYSSFAHDGLTYGLSLIFNERNACSVCPTQGTRIFHDLVKTANLSECTLVNNVLYMPKAVVRTAHPNLRRILNELAAAGWVRESRPCLRPGHRSKSVMYNVPIALLSQL